MLAHVFSWSEAAARWGPLVPLALVAAVALIEALALPRRIAAKGGWVLVVGACTALAFAGSLSQQRANRAAASDELAAETAALRGLWTEWDALSRSLPPPSGDSPAAAFDTVDDALASLSAKVASIEGQIAALKAGEKGRSVDDETAAKLADYLRQYGSYRAVVSCASGDLEAYTYANQLANILRAAGWDANGPEATTAPGEGTAMGVSLYVRNPAAPEAAKILVDAFTRFNIPYQSGVAASDAIPDTATVELFVAKKP
jgi:hypothetical protein